MKAVEILEAARAKIANPLNWTQGTFARDADGEGCSWDSENVKCFCSLGAMGAVMPQIVSHEEKVTAINALASAMTGQPYGSVGNFNDTHTHTEVLAAWDKAIVNLKSTNQGE